VIRFGPILEGYSEHDGMASVGITHCLMRPIMSAWARPHDCVGANFKEDFMPRGDKSSYTDKQKRKAEHIEEGYEHRSVPYQP
jgi:hypothetical protein